MTTRPRQPGPNAPAPGKLPLTELAEMKHRGEKIVMVTAYDAPGGELADAAGVDLILVGDSAAMVVLGHESTVPATVDELIVLTRAVTRGARRPLVIADMPFGSFQVSDDEAVGERRPLPQGGGRRGGQARGRRPDALARARARRQRDPGDGPHRPDAAVGDDARRLQRAGTHGREGGAPLRGRARARAGRLLRARARGGAGAGRGADHAGARDPDDRDRRGRGLRRPGARLPRPARPLRGPCAAVREALRRARAGDPVPRSRPTPRRCARARSRRRSTPTRCRTRSWPRSRRRSPRSTQPTDGPRAARRGARAPAGAPPRARPPPPSARPSSRAPPARRRRAARAAQSAKPRSTRCRASVPVPWSSPPARKRSPP